MVFVDAKPVYDFTVKSKAPDSEREVA
jgi:hypothetical protein